MEYFSYIQVFLPDLFILLGVGALAGIIGGMFGIGGGVVIVPALYYLTDQIDIVKNYEMQIIMGTTLATIIFTGLGSLKTHIKHKEIAWDAVKRLGLLLFLGAIFGAFLNSLFKNETITLMFAVFCTFIGIKMLWKKKEKSENIKPNKLFLTCLAPFVGGLSAMLGIGGGTMSVPLLNHFGYPIKIAMGTSSVLSAIIALSGTLSYIITGWNLPELGSHYLGYVNWVALICIIPASMMFAPLGAYIARQLNDVLLARIFGTFLLLNAIKMIYNAL